MNSVISHHKGASSISVECEVTYRENIGKNQVPNLIPVKMYACVLICCTEKNKNPLYILIESCDAPKDVSAKKFMKFSRNAAIINFVNQEQGSGLIQKSGNFGIYLKTTTKKAYEFCVHHVPV